MLVINVHVSDYVPFITINYFHKAVETQKPQNPRRNLLSVEPVRTMDVFELDQTCIDFIVFCLHFNSNAMVWHGYWWHSNKVDLL